MENPERFGVGGLQNRVIGAPIASADEITITHLIHHVTGTTATSTINAPAGFNGVAWFIPAGAWSVDTDGNIAKAMTFVANQAVPLIYDPETAKWYPGFAS